MSLLLMCLLVLNKEGDVMRKVSKIETLIWKLKKNDWSAYIFIIPAMIIVVMFILYPAIWSLVSSFKDVKPLMLRNGGLFEVPGKWIGFKNYLLTSKDYLFWLNHEFLTLSTT
ncbi:hypothetical protein [Caloranaerobacter azorensis]|uniref:hypothetical protein n=1 Tax=Caloranaerobacter azorensis TaxID=116090 RepID=UPI002585AD80|nr:hypothetical protein [Caloranaerobacter azorensis]